MALSFSGLMAFLERAGASQQDLAVAAGVTRSAVSQILNRHNGASLATIEAWWAWARGIDPNITFEELFGGPVPAPEPAGDGEPLEVELGEEGCPRCGLTTRKAG